MDHYASKLGKVSTAAATAAREMELDPRNEKLVAVSTKAAEKKARNEEKLAAATSAVAQCNDEFLSACEQLELHRASLLNDAANLPSLVSSVKELFDDIATGYSGENHTIPVGDIPPPTGSLLRKKSTG
jgi:hypothetical protein